jgi:alpha-L-arabinofuranosidase
MLMPRNIGTQVVKLSQTNPYSSIAKPITPQQSHVGFGTWGTKASYTHPEGVPKTGKPVFVSGQWQLGDDDVLRQTSLDEQCVAVCRTPFESDHYTCKFRARKDEGAEGFLIVFNYVDEHNYCWLNFGGWGNTQHAIEQIGNGGKIQTVTRRGRVEAGRWYDVTLTVSGDSVKAWLDQDLIFDTVLKRNTSLGVFSSATIDERSGELIVKVVNSQEEGTTARLNISNFDVKSAKVIRLRANSGEDENTLQQPTNIYPTEHELSPECQTVDVELPAYSLNIIRIKQ